MKKEAILLAAAIVLVGVAAFALGNLSSDSSDGNGSPAAFSLSPGIQGMIGDSGYYYDLYSETEAGAVLTTDEIVSRIQDYVEQQNNPNLAVARLREFNLAYQAEVVERDTGRHAFDLMVTKGASRISPAAGPNILWNTKYGPTIAEIGGGYGMLGRVLAQPTPGEMSFNETEARRIAETAASDLDADLTVQDESPATFYGFYEFYLDRDGEAVGALAVNGYSGQVWFEDWGTAQLSQQTLSEDTQTPDAADA